MDPNDPKSAGWAGLGGKPVYVNLNANSTHPRPWRPPTDWEHVMRWYDPYKINQDDSPQYFRRTHNWVEDDPFFKNVYWAAKKGFGFGLVAAFLDHTLYSRLQGPRAQMLRAAYVTLPIMAMPISYISLREFSANMIEKFTNKKRDSNWTYSIAALGPTGIVMGVAKKNFATGFLFFWTSALAGMLHKEYKQMGRDAWEKDNNLLEENRPRYWGPLDYKRASSRWSLYEKLDPGPTFEQFEEK